MFINCNEKELSILKKIGKAADEADMPCFLIGGFVRDKILNRPTKDIDIVCLGNGIELANKVSQTIDDKTEISFFKNFGTAQLKAGGFEIEFVGARKESYNPESRKPFVMPGSIEDDQRRRDFTINAMAISLNKGSYGIFTDPFNGMEHLQKKIIKTPLTPERTFNDDPLRMMRAIRFASQLGFEIENETFNAIIKEADRIKIVSTERITEEFNKIIMTKKPSIGFNLLHNSNLLKLIFPELVLLEGAEYIDGKGHKDNFSHTLQVLDNLSLVTEDIWLRWAAILHDIAKPATKKFEAGHGWTFHGHEVLGGRMVQKIFNRFKLPQNEKMKFVKKMVEMHLRPISLTKENITDSAIRRLLFDAGDDIDQLMTLCKADITSKNKVKVKRFQQNFDMVAKRIELVEQNDKMRNWQPPITGEIIMKKYQLPPCKQVGDLKSAIREAILDGIIPNDFESAYNFMEKQAAKFGIVTKNI